MALEVPHDVQPYVPEDRTYVKAESVIILTSEDQTWVTFHFRFLPGGHTVMLQHLRSTRCLLFSVPPTHMRT